MFQFLLPNFISVFLPLCDLRRHCEKCFLSLANSKALAPDLRVFIGVVHKHPETKKIVLRDQVVIYVWVEQDSEAKLSIGTIDLKRCELDMFASLRATDNRCINCC